MVNLNIAQLSRELARFSQVQAEAWPARKKALATARKLLRAQMDTWDQQHQRGLRVSWLMATPLEDPTRSVAPKARPKHGLRRCLL